MVSTYQEVPADQPWEEAADITWKKDELLISNHEATLEYSIANVVANGWRNIADDEHFLYWVKGNSTLSALVFNKKLLNQLIMYLKGRVSTRNLRSKIVKFK